MAIDSIPAWLNTSPSDYLRAAISGGDAGISIGRMATEAALQRESMQAQAARQAAVIASEQATRAATQRFQEMQLARQQHVDAIQQAKWEAEYGLHAHAAATKAQAMAEYRQRISNGEDPLSVMMELGPAAGLGSSAEAAAIRADRLKPAARMPEVAFTEVDGKQVPYLINRMTGAAAWLPPGFMAKNKSVELPEVQYTEIDGQKIPYLVDKATGRGTWLPSGYLNRNGNKLTDDEREQLRDLRKERDTLQKKWSDPLNRKLAEKDLNLKAELDADTTRLGQVNSSISEITGGRSAGASAADPTATAAPGPSSSTGTTNGIRILSIRPKDASSAAVPTQTMSATLPDGIGADYTPAQDIDILPPMLRPARSVLHWLATSKGLSDLGPQPQPLAQTTEDEAGAD